MRTAALGTVAGAAVLACGTQTAAAAEQPADPTVVGHGTSALLDTVTGLKVNPLSGTGVDPLSNGVGTQVADFKPVSTAQVTGPLSGASVGELADGLGGARQTPPTVAVP